MLKKRDSASEFTRVKSSNKLIDLSNHVIMRLVDNG